MQPPPKPWKRAIFSSIAAVESALRRSESHSPAELLQIRNFLVLQYDSPLGSVVHATPFYEALKTAIPDAHVTVAASSMAASVLQHNPFVDHCVLTAQPFQSFLPAFRDVRQLVGTMPAGPRCIVTTIGNQRTRVAALGFGAGGGTRAGYTLAPDLYRIPLVFRPERGQIEGNLDILRALGHGIPFYEPRVFFTNLEAEYADQVLTPAVGDRRPLVAFVTQNSGGQRNQWPQDRFKQVIAKLSAECGATPLFLGTAADEKAIESLRSALPGRGISLAGKTTVPQLAAMLAQCDLVVSLDTGTFHVARAVGLPGLVIAPAWQSPREWLPVDHPRYRVLRGPSIATVPDTYCIEEVSVQQVTDAAMHLLSLFPADEFQRSSRVQRSLRR